MDGHEWPYLVRGNSTPLARGMTFSDEPGIYIPGEFGVRLEDDMHITKDGGATFSRRRARRWRTHSERRNCLFRQPLTCHPELSAVLSLREWTGGMTRVRYDN